jgi:hypothetical protein
MGVSEQKMILQNKGKTFAKRGTYVTFRLQYIHAKMVTTNHFYKLDEILWMPPWQALAYSSCPMGNPLLLLHIFHMM